MIHNGEIELGSIGSRLRIAREKTGLTQKEVAERLNIPKYQTISAYENDKNSPKLDTLKDLCRIYGVTSDYILFGSEKSVIKSNKDYLMQFVEAADYFGFRVTAPMETQERTLDKPFPKSIRAVEVYPFANPQFDTEDFDAFLSRWHDLRSVLDNGTIEHDTYIAVLAQKAASLSEFVFDGNNLPF